MILSKVLLSQRYLTAQSWLRKPTITPKSRSYEETGKTHKNTVADGPIFEPSQVVFPESPSSTLLTSPAVQFTSFSCLCECIDRAGACLMKETYPGLMTSSWSSDIFRWRWGQNCRSTRESTALLCNYKVGVYARRLYLEHTCARNSFRNEGQ